MGQAGLKNRSTHRAFVSTDEIEKEQKNNEKEMENHQKQSDFEPVKRECFKSHEICPLGVPIEWFHAPFLLVVRQAAQRWWCPIPAGRAEQGSEHLTVQCRTLS